VVGKYVSPHEAGLGSSGPPHGIYINTPNDSSLYFHPQLLHLCGFAMTYSLLWLTVSLVPDKERKVNSLGPTLKWDWGRLRYYFQYPRNGVIFLMEN